MDIQQFAKYQHASVRNELLHNLCLGKSCMLLGFPGSGKTVMTADIIKTLILDCKKKVAITGSTGSAAQQIKSLLPDMDIRVQTVHSFFGFQKKESFLIEQGQMEEFEKHARQRSRNHWMREVRNRILECDILIVDEISMLTSEFITAIDITSKLSRGCFSKKFGGLTLCLIGDFRQLPPVSKSRHTYLFQDPKYQGDNWIDVTFSLEFILRQNLDYSETILRLSHNLLSEDDKMKFAAQVVPDGKNKIMDVDFLPEALRVFHTNNEVNRYNDMVTHRAIEEGSRHVALQVKWHIPNGTHCKLEELQLDRDKVHSAKLFVGAQVIITSNLDIGQGIVNGTTGRVIDIEDKNTRELCAFGGSELSQYVTLQLDNGSRVKIGSHCLSKEIDGDKELRAVKVWYMPLLLSHAITVHRLQGSTIKRQLFYMPKAIGRFCREFYVITTRVTSLDLLHLTHLPHNLNHVMDPVVIEFYLELFRNK